MWYRVVVVLAALSAVRCQDQNAGGGPAAFGSRGAAAGFMEPRLGTAAMRLGHIESSLEKLRERINEASKVDGQAFIDDIEERLDHVEAKTDHCDSEKEIRCGRETLECVNTLLLCDGHEDCHNGYDESEHVCDAGPAVIGNVFTGTAHWTSCRPKHDHPIKITITQTYKSKFFGARLIVKGVVTSDAAEDEGGHHEYEAKGYFVYGKKRLVLFPANDDDARQHLGVLCDFVHGNDNTAECKLGSEASLHECASFHVTLQEEEHH